MGMVDSSPARMCIPIILENEVQRKMLLDPCLDSVYTIGIACSYFPCHILSRLPRQLSEYDGQARVLEYNVVVHLTVYVYQSSHTEILENWV